MPEMENRAAFERLFATFEHSAWRLETQGVYHETDEAEPFRRFMAGEPDDLSWFEDWLDMLGSAMSSGRKVGRVRVLTEPLTNYLRFELGTVSWSAVAAGEDIRVLSADAARRLAVGSQDFWLFDDRTVALLHFGPGGVVGAEIITEPDQVARYRAVRRAALSGAVAFRDWAASAADLR